jgi:signal transduction histidine kinase
MTRYCHPLVFLVCWRLFAGDLRGELAPAAAPRTTSVAKNLLIVGPEVFHPALSEFMVHKRRLLPTELRSLETILRSTAGVDDPERLKRFLHIEWQRGDLGYVLLVGDVAQKETPATPEGRTQIERLCYKARGLSVALDEVIWLVNSRRDTLRDFASHACKFAQSFLAETPIRCRLDVESELPTAPFDLPVRRNLFLAVKEAVNNAAKYSSATELFLRNRREAADLVVEVEDNGRGCDPLKADQERNGLNNMAQRLAEIDGRCSVLSEPGKGCKVVFRVPLEKPHAAQAGALKHLFTRAAYGKGEDMSATRSRENPSR